jgi:hypothetical protein
MGMRNWHTVARERKGAEAKVHNGLQEEEEEEAEKEGGRGRNKKNLTQNF